MVPSPDIETASYDYATRFSGNVGHWFLSMQEAAVERLLLPDPKSILDVGGGHGQLTQLLTKKTTELITHGSSEKAFSEQWQIVKKQRSDASKVCISPLNNLPFGENAITTLTAVRLLAHYENWQALIKELCRVAAKQVIIDIPVYLSLNALTPLFFLFKKKLEGNTREYILFWEGEVDRVFAQYGFAPAGRSPQFFWPMVVHRKLRSISLAQLCEALPVAVGLRYLFGSPVIKSYIRLS